MKNYELEVTLDTKYPALRTIVTILKVMAIIVIVLGVGLGIGITAAGAKSSIPLIFGSTAMFAIVCVMVSLVTSLFLYASAELIVCFMDIESGIRKLGSSNKAQNNLVASENPRITSVPKKELNNMRKFNKT